MPIAFIGLGSNLGDREASLAAAIARIADTPRSRVLRTSSTLETAAVDSPAGAGDFLNGVVMLETQLSPEELLQQLLVIERALGRDRSGQHRNAPRTIDLDLLLYGGLVIDQPDLKVPHPRMHEREFVLWPLLQIDSKVTDPRTGQPFADAYRRLRAH